MQKIILDGRECDLNALSNTAKGHFTSLRFADRELERLQAQAAVLQTARSNYPSTLREALSLDAPNTKNISIAERVSDPQVPETPVETDERPAREKGFFSDAYLLLYWLQAEPQGRSNARALYCLPDGKRARYLSVGES